MCKIFRPEPAPIVKQAVGRITAYYDYHMSMVAIPTEPRNVCVHEDVLQFVRTGIYFEQTLLQMRFQHLWEMNRDGDTQWNQSTREYVSFTALHVRTLTTGSFPALHLWSVLLENEERDTVHVTDTALAGYCRSMWPIDSVTERISALKTLYDEYRNIVIDALHKYKTLIVMVSTIKQEQANVECRQKWHMQCFI